MQRKHARHQTQKSFMFRHYECKNAYEKQEKTQNMKMQRSNKKIYQEQLEDHEEHYECMNFRKMHKIFRKNAIDTKLKN